MRHFHLMATAAGLLAATGCASARGTAPDVRPVGEPLRARAEARGVMIGAAADAGLRLGGAAGDSFRTILGREFDEVTPENSMKHARVHPARDVYTFGDADALVAFAQQRGMTVRGHTLVWHRQLAPWLTRGTWTREQARALLEEHIDSVAGHFRGRIAAWDVVNEAVADDATMRRTFWSEAVGPDYIEIAFHRAAAADPGAKLFYNDYNVEGINPKSDSVYALLQRLLARGVPVHGVGLQAHFEVGTVPPTLAANIARFAALGLEVHITELDVRVPQPSTAAQREQQARDYAMIAGACLAAPQCKAIVLWGFTDALSWIPREFPGWGDAHPFDAQYRPKAAWAALRDAFEARTVP